MLGLGGPCLLKALANAEHTIRVTGYFLVLACMLIVERHADRQA